MLKRRCVKSTAIGKIKLIRLSKKRFRLSRGSIEG
jgi:hypothetical protein